MAEFQSRVRTGSTAIPAVDPGLRAYMLRVYNYMLMGLALTGGVAFAVTNTPLGAAFFTFNEGGQVLGPNILGWIAIFAPLGLVFFLSFRIQRMSLAAAQGTFWAYAGLMGVSMALILAQYTATSAARVFFITAATFGAMSLWGYTTKRDLTGMGSFLFMGLIGILIASVVNMFLGSTMLQFIVSVAGVLVFTGLTAYDTQKSKENYSVAMDGTAAGKSAVMGALNLYLDFINLFMMLLRLLGDRR